MIIKSNFDLTNYNSYRITSFCKTAYFPTTEQDFIDLYREFGDTPKNILGGGNNVILSKEYYDSDFVIIDDNYAKLEIDGTFVTVESGMSLKTLSEIALDKELSGLEIFYDIPSSVGGAIVMNAGAGGEEIKSLVKKVRYLDLVDLSIKEKASEDINFDYRNSYFQKNTDKIVLKSFLELKRGLKADIEKKMEDFKALRWSKQPKDFPSAGSVFKRPEGKFVGPMIDALHLKGVRVGGAEVSVKHGGFIINVGSATGKDVLDLIDIVKEKVLKEFGLELQIEQRII